MQRLATAPGCVLGHLSDAGCARSRHAESCEGNGASWACAIRGEELLMESCQLAGRLRTLGQMDPRDSEKRCWNADPGHSGCCRNAQKRDRPFPQAFQRAKKEHAAPPSNEARCRKRVRIGQCNTACRVKLRKEAFKQTKKGFLPPEAMTSGPAQAGHHHHQYPGVTGRHGF
ncbi:hypothetical protein Tc00.1047053506529.370 [Trypanosoma cruzi]|uniref:Uncharacterized protein n=2 Tax=Trypanosoma cruzi TaxID=5693 RepID=Q4E5P4_TRYCC|nr:hypothetical protein Tc00.1047053506529.370 [Trypanosoma cruzi]AAN78344.1 TcC31.33 [Trypanosoma cruzi]EAO00077.1 hypothetical protein Tc00.1047053506529.370 [Trypanosoma cruzi]|eukprot:XP_821928.1 hypothetical protein [Trypanosoma cruzi strain CL Brener]